MLMSNKNAKFNVILIVNHRFVDSIYMIRSLSKYYKRLKVYGE